LLEREGANGKGISAGGGRALLKLPPDQLTCFPRIQGVWTVKNRVAKIETDSAKAAATRSTEKNGLPREEKRVNDLV